MNHDLENLDVNLAIQELEAGGPGSGCNPEVGHCGRPAGLSQKENDWKSKLSAEVQNYDSEKEFTDSVLIHGTNAPQGSKIDFVEPRVGEFTKQFYNDEGVDLKPLAFFHSGDSPISSVAHYATGVGVFTKKETPYLLVTKIPSDAYKVGEDGEVLTLDGDLISHDAPYGTESGDIFSEEGASVIAQIPLKDFHFSSLGDFYRSAKGISADIDLDAAVAEIVAASGMHDPGKYDFDKEKQIREQMQLIAHYAEEGPTFDPAGKYLCGSCRYRMVVDSGPMDECYSVTGTTKMATGSCGLYVIGNVESEHNPLPMLERYTQLEAGYAERKNGFGCQNCEFASKAKKPDPDGRKLWCRFFGTHVTKTACCDRESGPDMVLAPGEKK